MATSSISVVTNANLLRRINIRPSSSPKKNAATKPNFEEKEFER